ncbi:MAG: pilus assembly protein PilP [Deltaproteobacteria bacterium]|nr:pilus assembly protein PilP [Deltaproteobacteria bacterium]MBW2123980.1 pilus assembly protein PilP [Deltaproteobacteria bacterium]
MKGRSSIRRLSNILILLVGMALAVPACEKSPPPPPIKVTKRPRKKTKSARTSSSAGKMATLGKKPTFSYNPQGLADPFQPFIQVGSSGKTLKGVPRTPLQEYNLSQLTLTAIIWMDGGESRALVRDSAGKGFTLKRGTYIGNRGGRVKAIKRNRVIIEEPMRVYGKESKMRQIVMKMPAEGGKK